MTPQFMLQISRKYPFQHNVILTINITIQHNAVPQIKQMSAMA
jgi:hypothetical protein